MLYLSPCAISEWFAGDPMQNYSQNTRIHLTRCIYFGKLTAINDTILVFLARYIMVSLNCRGCFAVPGQHMASASGWHYIEGSQHCFNGVHINSIP